MEKPASVPPGTVAAPNAEELYKQQRLERAKAQLAEGIARYDAGNYADATTNLLTAIDSGVLPVADVLHARKHLAFIYAVSNREANCREEFEKAFLLDPKFELTAAESGHPGWGPVYRAVKAEVELRRAGRAPAPPKAPSAGEKLLSDAIASYDQGDYSKTIKLLQDALKETLSTLDRVRALKISAFSYCLINRAVQCRAEFEKIFQLKPDFALDPAEVGHPSWGPSYRAAKSRQSAPPTPIKK